MSTFQRARTDEQRTARQAEIVAAARAMLTELPLTEITLNALSRRVGLAASNVLRYYESREAILLELVHLETASWLDAFEALLAKADQTVEGTADAYARSLAANPLFCELISAQALVLERKISAETAIAFKRESSADLQRLTDLLIDAVPELGDQEVVSRLAARSTLLAGALWAQARVTPDVDFTEAIRDTFHTLLIGTIARLAG